MAQKRKQFHKGIKLKPTDDAVTEEGELKYDDSLNALVFKNDQAGEREVADLDSVQTVSNKTLDSTCSINAAAIIGALDFEDDEFKLIDTTLPGKELVFDVAGSDPAVTTVQTSSTVNRTIILPDAADTLVGKATTDSLTNKTFDADGTGNSITNIEDADIKAAAGIEATKSALSGGYVAAQGNPAATDTVEAAIAKLDGNQDDLVTLSGVAVNGEDLGGFYWRNNSGNSNN